MIQVQEFEYPEIYDRAAKCCRDNIRSSGPMFSRRAGHRPGPGHDVGTLVVWSDGVVFFVLDSGDLDACSFATS